MTAKSLKHKFASAVADGADATLVRPSNWNDDHNFYLGVNAQANTSYTIADTDAWTLITYNNAAAVAVTLPQAGASAQFQSGHVTFHRNLGAGLVTITPATSTINGAATLVLVKGQDAVIISDGTNYAALVFAPVATQIKNAIVAPQGRCTLTSGTPFTTSDVTTAATVFYTPTTGNLVPIYDGTQWFLYSFAEPSVALDSNSGHTGWHQSGGNFDLFVINDAGTIRFGSGPVWNAGTAGSDTARGTGAGSTELQLLNGIQTNKNSIAIRWGTASGNTTTVAANQATYVGTFRTTGTNAQTEDSLAKRFVWNAYNKSFRTMKVTEATGSWNYSTAAWRQSNNSTANQLDFVLGLPGVMVDAIAIGTVGNSSSTVRTCFVGIGLDRTNASDAQIYGALLTNGTANTSGRGDYSGYPGLGRHFLAWLEFGGGTDTQSWQGSSGAAQGIVGSLLG